MTDSIARFFRRLSGRVQRVVLEDGTEADGRDVVVSNLRNISDYLGKIRTEESLTSDVQVKLQYAQEALGEVQRDIVEYM